MKKIGVLGGLQGTVFGVTIPYYELAAQFGEVVLINPLSKTVNKDIDLLILVGGADRSPLAYNEVPSLRTNKPNPVREWFDTNMLPEYIKNKTPLFGVCLGLQSLVIHFGGRLIQHNSLYHPFSADSRDELVHNIALDSNGLRHLARYKTAYNYYLNNKRKKWEVNSLHHQSALPTELGEGLVSLFNVQGFDNTCEILTHKELPIVSTQFHPECMEGDLVRGLTDSLIEDLLYPNK